MALTTFFAAKVVCDASKNLDSCLSSATWTDGLTAVGTVGAFVVGLVLLGGQLKEFRLQNEERRRSQADKVSGWVLDVTRDSEATPRDVRFAIRNASDLPVYECIVAVRPTWQDWKPTDQQTAGGLGLRTIAPDATVETELTDLSDLTPELLAVPVEFMFTDAGGRHWRRDINGTLSQIKTNSGYGLRGC
jgi:hypothetical protein